MSVAVHGKNSGSSSVFHPADGDDGDDASAAPPWEKAAAMVSGVVPFRGRLRLLVCADFWAKYSPASVARATSIDRRI